MFSRFSFFGAVLTVRPSTLLFQILRKNKIKLKCDSPVTEELQKLYLSLKQYVGVSSLVKGTFLLF